MDRNIVMHNQAKLLFNSDEISHPLPTSAIHLPADLQTIEDRNGPGIP